MPRCLPVERTAFGTFIAALVSCVSLGCDDKPAAADKRTEPWPAPAVASETSALQRGIRHEYELEPAQTIEFELKTKTTTITGLFPIVRGSLSIDLMRLARSDSKLSIDLGATRITSGLDAENANHSITAQNWLNVGASLPEASRERRRWATFLLEKVEHTGVDAAHEAPVARQAMKDLEQAANAESPDAGLSDASAEPPSMPSEIRATRARLLGSLEMNNRRVTQHYEVELQFLYPARATPGLTPDVIVVNSTQAVRIPLAQYEIQPRNAAGVLIASDLKLLGSEVGRVAKLKFSLRFKMQSGHGGSED